MCTLAPLEYCIPSAVPVFLSVYQSSQMLVSASVHSLALCNVILRNKK